MTTELAMSMSFQMYPNAYMGQVERYYCERKGSSLLGKTTLGATL